MIFRRQFTDANGASYRMEFIDQASADAYVPPSGRTEFVLVGGEWDPYTPPEPTAAELSVTDTARLNAVLMAPGSIDRAEFKTLFNHENRIRALEAKAPISQAAFIDAVRATIR